MLQRRFRTRALGRNPVTEKKHRERPDKMPPGQTEGEYFIDYAYIEKYLHIHLFSR